MAPYFTGGRSALYLTEHQSDGVVSSQAVFFPEFIHLAVVDEFIGPADADDGGVEVVVAEEFNNAGAKAVGEHVVFHSTDDLAFLRIGPDEVGIEGFDEAWVDQGDRMTE